MNINILNPLSAPHPLIEDKISFSAHNSELTVYSTYEASSQVRFQSNELLFGGMLVGRKVMRTQNITEEQIFLPHESYIIAPNEVVEIDFPEATLDTPTKCLVVEISKEKVGLISERLSDSLPMLEDINHAQLGQPVLRTHHTTETQQLLYRLAKLFSENDPDRQLLIDLHVSELIIRLLRHKTRDFLLAYCTTNPETDRLMASLSWIRNNLSKPLDINKLCRHVGMSRSRFYVEFKKKLACSPVELQQQLRLQRAADRIKQGEAITTISYELGFNNPSHFCQRFKGFFGCTATTFRQRYQVNGGKNTSRH
jgi:AraC-like DNA-binding protein